MRWFNHMVLGFVAAVSAASADYLPVTGPPPLRYLAALKPMKEAVSSLPPLSKGDPLPSSPTNEPAVAVRPADLPPLVVGRPPDAGPPQTTPLILPPAFQPPENFVAPQQLLRFFNIQNGTNVISVPVSHPAFTPPRAVSPGGSAEYSTPTPK